MQKEKPQRMCCVCRTHKEKTELLRVVKKPDGSVGIDKTMKAAGRGAYICKTQECVENAEKRRALERSLSTAVEPEVYKMIRKEILNG